MVVFNPKGGVETVVRGGEEIVPSGAPDAEYTCFFSASRLFISLGLTVSIAG
jgi:hypothetical protein